MVILTGINSAPARGGNPVIVDRGSGRVEVGVGSANARFATPGFEELLEFDNRMSAEEHIRLMYVATTRARGPPGAEHAPSGQGRRKLPRQRSRSTWRATKISGNPSNSTNRTRRLQLSLPSSGDQPHVIDETLHSTEHLDRWVAERKRTIDGFSRPQFVAATGLSRAYKDEEEEPDSPEPWRRGRAGTSVGRAVHAVLQSIDLATGAGVEHRARAQAVAEGVPDREAEVSRLVEVAVQSDIVRRAVASQRIWREVPVAAPVGDGSLHGFIDLLFEEGNGLVVVDYKTDAVTEEQLPEVIDRYRLQGGAYAHAIRQVTGKAVKEVVFLYLQPKREVALPDLAGAMADARDGGPVAIAVARVNRVAFRFRWFILSNAGVGRGDRPVAPANGNHLNCNATRQPIRLRRKPARVSVPKDTSRISTSPELSLRPCT